MRGNNQVIFIFYASIENGKLFWVPLAVVIDLKKNYSFLKNQFESKICPFDIVFLFIKSR